mgnify:FL=1|tara:strand:+ start:573 stop:1025 length:453 start_codon:yes stop_codon:yes gene_type:complete
MSKRERTNKGKKSRKNKKVKLVPERHPDQDIINLLFLEEAIVKSYKKNPTKKMTANEYLKWLKDVIDKTTPPRQVGVRPNFAPDEEAQMVAYGRRLQDLNPTPTPISLIKSSSNFKGNLFKGGKKRKTRRFKKKRRKRRKRRRKSTRKRR